MTTHTVPLPGNVQHPTFTAPRTARHAEGQPVATLH